MNIELLNMFWSSLLGGWGAKVLLVGRGAKARLAGLAGGTPGSENVTQDYWKNDHN